MNKNSNKTGKVLSKEFTDRIGQFSSDNQPTPEQKKAGWAKWRARKELKDDIFKTLVGMGTLDTGVNMLDEFVRNDKISEKDRVYLLTKLLDYCSTPDRQEHSVDVRNEIVTEEEYNKVKALKDNIPSD